MLQNWAHEKEYSGRYPGIVFLIEELSNGFPPSKMWIMDPIW